MRRPFFQTRPSTGSEDDIHRTVSVGHPPDRLTDKEWFEAKEDYNGWEYDGKGHQMFGYLRISRGSICFSKFQDLPAHEANRYSYYRYVVSFEGSGWVPMNVLTACAPPMPPLVAYSTHTLDRCFERMPFIVDDDNAAMDELERILYSPQTKLIASWSSPDKYDRKVPRYPVLWHHHPSRGTLVSYQFNDKPLHDPTVRCVTYLAPDMAWKQSRRRTPGLMKYDDDPLHVLLRDA